MSMQPMQSARKRFARWALCLSALLALIEGTLFQCDYFATRQLTPVLVPAEEYIIVEETVTIPVSMPLETVQITLSGPREIVSVQVLVQDAAYQNAFALAYTLKAVPGVPALARVQSNGLCSAVQIILPDNCSLSSVALNVPRAYHFSCLRYFALLLPLLAIALIGCFKLWRIPLRRNAPRHRACYALTCAACIALSVGVSALCSPADTTPFPYTKALEYPFESSTYQYRPFTHALLFDALMKGQLCIDETPSDALLALDNPYDPTQRAEGTFMLDYALYDGAYYAYFGLAPVLTFYAPFYLLFGYLPAYTTAAGAFAIFGILSAFLCMWEMTRRFARQPSLLLTCLGAAAVALGSNMLMVQACADRYYLSVASMQAYFFLTLWSALCAVRQKRRLPRTLYFATCALFTTLLVASRPTGALAAAGWIVPIFTLVLLSRKHPLRRKAADALSFLLPLSLGAALIMVYNAARFGSPFEFGQRWQLTLEDIHYNRLTPRALGQALYYYFLDGLRLVPEFPYLVTSTNFINRTGNWFYGVANAGALTMPVTWGAALLFAGENRRSRKGICLCALLTLLPLAVCNFTLAGVAQRYVCDLLPTLCLAGALALSDSPRPRTALLLYFGTFLVALAMVFSNYRNFVALYSPETYLTLFNTFTLL